MLSLALSGVVARAHQPHDPSRLLAVSPGVSTDGIVFVDRLPSQNWRSPELVRSSDGGVTFEYAFRGIPNLTPFSSVALSPRFDLDGVGFVTTEGAGAWLTTDFGDRWSRTALGSSAPRVAVAHDGSVPVLLAALAGAGVLRSVDLGATWTRVADAAGTEAMATLDAEVALVASGRAHVSHDAGLTWASADLGVDALDVATAAGVVVAGTEVGVLVSRDDGPFLLLPELREPIDAVGVSPGWPGDPTLFVAPRRGGMFVSEDGGATFVERPTGLALSPQTERHTVSIAFSRHYPSDGTVFASTFEGVISSRDFGRTWVEADARSPGLINAIALSPDFASDGLVVVATADGGALVSTDAGDTFRNENDEMIISSVYDASIIRRADGGLDVALPSNGRIYWGEEPLDAWAPADLPDELSYTTRLAFSPDHARDGTALLGTRYEGLFHTEDRGATWVPVPVDVHLTATSSIAFLHDGATVLVGTNGGRLLRSTDAGRTLRLVQGVATGPEPVFVASDPNGFLVGSAAGLSTSPDGRTFTPVPGMDQLVHQVAAGPDGTRFAVMRGGGMYRSEPGGSWVAIAPELSALGCPHELAVSPQFAADGTVFAAIDDHLFRSRDRGDTWEAIGVDRVRYEEDAQALRPHNALLMQRRASPQASASKVALLTPGQALELRFSGTGVVWLAPSDPELGTAEVSVDGVVMAQVALDGPFRPQVEQFRVDRLPPGVHELRIEPTGSAPIAVDAVDVLRGPPPEPPERPEPTRGGRGTGWEDDEPLVQDTGRPTAPATPRAPAIRGHRCGTAGIGGSPALVLLALAAGRRRRVVG